VESKWGDRDYFYVEIDPATNTVVGCVRDGVLVLVCREMPRPMRIRELQDGGAALGGGGDVVVLERNAIERNLLYAMKVVASDQPASIVDGLPHVSHHLIPTNYRWWFS